MKNIIIGVVSFFFLNFPVAKAATILTFGGQGWITQGNTYTASEQTGFVLDYTNVYGDFAVQFWFDNPTTKKQWIISFSSSAGDTLHVGMYQNATIYKLPQESTPGLDLFGYGRASGSLTGWFNILEIQFSSSTQMGKFATDFYFVSDNNPNSWTQGSIRVNSDLKVGVIPEPGPVMISSVSVILLSLLLRVRPKYRK